MERKLVTLRTVKELLPIEGADFIVLAKIDGWQCVVKKDEFEVGDIGVYFEIDSMIPHEDWSEFLFKNQKDIDKGYVRIKTIRLRSTLSQGLMIPLHALVGKDLTETMGVVKYESPQPQDSHAKNYFPSFIQKTDEERVQNLVDQLPEYCEKNVYETEKLDGSSFTAYCRWNEIDDAWEYGVCSRNLELKLEYINDEGELVPSQSKFVKVAREMQLHEKMLKWCKKNKKDLVLQGELIGKEIQGNKYKLPYQKVCFFTAQDGKHMRYSFNEFIEVITDLGLETVPILNIDVSLRSDYDKLLVYSDGESALGNTIREGIIYRAMDGSFSFKVISNKFLLKNEKRK